MYKGKDLRIKLGDKVLYHATECNFDISMEFEAVASKDTNGKKKISGDYEWSLSTSSLIANKPALSSTQLDVKDILSALIAGTPYDIEFTTDVVGDFVISGSVYVESLQIAAANGQVATGSFNFTGDGEIEVASVA